MLALLPLLAYTLLSSLIGYLLCRYLRINLGNLLANLVVGFLFSELVSLLFFWIVSRHFRVDFSTAFLPQCFGAGLLFFSSSLRLLLPRTETPKLLSLLKLLLMATILATTYVLTFGTMVSSALLNDGVIYQDVVWHAGVSMSLMNSGFPVPDIQVFGHDIRYHLFTHFVAAKTSWVSGWPVIQIYMVVMPILFFAMFPVATYSFFATYTSGDQPLTFLLSSAACLSPLVIGILGGGNENSSFWFSPIFSYSYGWQLVSLTLFLTYLKSSDALQGMRENSRQIIPLGFFVVLSALIKGSSLPLLIGGLGISSFFDVAGKKRFNYPLALNVVLLSCIGFATYLLFFHKPGLSNSNGLALNLEGFDNSLWPAFFGKIGLGLSDQLKSVVWIAALISYRFIAIYDWRSAETRYVCWAFVVSLPFYFFYQNNPLYFLLPAIYMTNLFAMSSMIKRWHALSKWLKSLLILLVICSTYPIGLGHLNALQKYEWSRKIHNPINQLRVELYSSLRRSSRPSDLIFTPSNFGTKEPSLHPFADNFYPAVLSERQFFLGGYRFSPLGRGGSEDRISSDHRLDIANSFELTNAEHCRFLANRGVTFVLIESVGNHPNAAGWYSNTKFDPSLYTLIYSNEAGAIFAVNTLDAPAPAEEIR